MSGTAAQIRDSVELRQAYLGCEEARAGQAAASMACAMPIIQPQQLPACIGGHGTEP